MSLVIYLSLFYHTKCTYVNYLSNVINGEGIMKKTRKEDGFMMKLAAFIVDKRNLFFLLTALMLIFSAFSRNWVEVENDLAAYLPDTSDTRQGLDVMEEQFTTFGTAQVLTANISREKAQELREKIAEQKGVQSILFDETKDHYNHVSALYTVTFDYDEKDDRCLEALEQVKETLAGYDVYVTTELGNPLSEIIDSEVSAIMVYVTIIIIVVLLLTSQTYAEMPVLILTFGAAMVLNQGTNFLLGKISFVSNSVTSVLQLALSLDYAIILCNRYKEEHQQLPLREAVVVALSKAIPEIGASSLTTIGGLVAMMFMQFKIGPDMGIAILQKCVNSGNVTSRKDYAGGVCGRMDLGFAAGCESYGRIQSENGSYVGGIAGFSTGIVRGCFAKCSLAGKKYIGGIVGSGGDQDTESGAGKVQGCYSMVDIVSYEQYAGAVAGIDEGSYGENFFVSDSLAGIGRCSITGQAEPMEYKALLEVEGLPQQFRQLTVRFIEEENLIQQFSLNYGEGLDPKDFPVIPEREGYFSRWSEEELEQLHFDVDVEAVYKLYETALPSKEAREDGREVFFVEGQFDDRAKLRTRQMDELSEDGSQEEEPELSDAGLPGKSRREESWQLEIPDDGAPSHMARYLSPDGKTEGWSVYVYQDGAWKNAKAKAVGSYLEFEVKGNNVCLAVVRHVRTWGQAAALPFALIVAALFGIGFLKWKKGAKVKK